VATIAVAVDGTEASAAALAFAIDKARCDGAQLTGVFVLDSGWTDFIANDWQSSRNARQGFLDYVRAELEKQQELAQQQFAAVTPALMQTSFSVLTGDPAESLTAFMRRGDADMLVIGAAAFVACGRPSAKALAVTLTRDVPQPVYVV
jgi:nucleotide-binding universal stress UspA family protein